ncbi:MAG: hypothetical protein IJH39_10740 [Clostridia bacterium]|nr:hypothetical protein [Clostridia bacterium]
MEKKKSLLIALILIVMISITTSVNAATWQGQTTTGSTVNQTRTVTGVTLYLTYGEVDGSGNLITRVSIPLSTDENTPGTVKAGCSANHYTMSLDNAEANGVVTGLDSTQTQNGGEKLIVNALKTGTQTVHIITRNTGNDWPAGVEAYDNTVNVISYYSTNFQNAASALDITFNGNNTVYYSENMNIYPEDNNKFEAILNAKSKYNALNAYEKQRLDSIIASASNGTYANYNELYNVADNYLTSLARTFITSTSVNGLKGNTVANKDNCETIINAQTEYNNLKNIVKDRVNLILTSEPSATYGGYSSVDYPTLLVNAKAYKFIKTYIIDTPDVNLSKINDEKILDSEINSDYKWSDLDSDVKSTVDSILTSAVGRNYASQIAYVRNHLEQTIADTFVDNIFLANYEELAGTKSLRNYNKNTALNQEVTDIYEDLAKKITGDVDTEYNSIASNPYVNETSLKQKIDNEIANSDYASILGAAQDYLADLEEARNFVAEHKLNDELTTEIAEDIITLDNAIDDERVKAMVEEMIGKTMEQKIQEADDFLTALADKFIEDNKLNEELTKSIANDIVNNLENNYNAIPSNIVKERVDQKLEISIDEIVEEAKDFLDRTAAKEFYDNYLEGLDEEKIVAGEDTWNNSSDKVKGLINDLLVANNVDSTYPELLEKAREELINRAAEEFINDYLTDKDGKVIGEVNNSNYKKVIKAAEPYEALSEEVKDLVNSKLKANVDTTYPELLSAAQAIEKSPKTGDLSGIMIGVLIVSVIGIAAVIRKRK